MSFFFVELTGGLDKNQQWEVFGAFSFAILFLFCVDNCMRTHSTIDMKGGTPEDREMKISG